MTLAHNMKKTLVALLPLVLGISQADTIKLKDGTKLEGTILSETEDSYVAMINVTKSIRDQRTIAKSDVVSVVKVSQDEVEIPGILALVPTPDLMSKAEYEERIEKAETFIKAYPESLNDLAAKKVLKTLKDEYAEIEKGGIKMDGKMIPASERAPRAYGLDAEVAFSKFKELADENQYIPALRAWDDFSKKYPTTQAYKDALPVVNQLLKDLYKMLGMEIKTYEERVAKRNEDFKKIPSQDKARTKKAILDDKAAYEQKMEEEKKAGERWISVSVWNKDAMTTVREEISKEFKTLKEVNPSEIPNGDEIYAESWKTLNGDPEPEAAQEAIKAAEDAGIPEAYLKNLQEMAPAPADS